MTHSTHDTRLFVVLDPFLALRLMHLFPRGMGSDVRRTMLILVPKAAIYSTLCPQYTR